MTDIEPGDLIRAGYSGAVKVAENGGRFETIQVIAKGPGWVRHDGSSVNPVPGAEVSAFGDGVDRRPVHSGGLVWAGIQFYRVTREAPSQPPAPQPGWVATVTIERTSMEHGFRPRVCFQGSHYLDIPRPLFDALDWSPPPPPPWEPVVGGVATFWGDQITILGIYKDKAVVESVMGEVYLARLTFLSPPKGGV
jgi:hypothetical protein